MILYHIASITKILLGASIVLITYSSINVYEDPAIAIGLGFVGLFIGIWGLSFYIFLLFQNSFRRYMSSDRIMKDSYKLSLLFGIYVIINLLLLLLGSWNKRWGILLLVGFIGLQMILFKQSTPDNNDNTQE